MLDWKEEWQGGQTHLTTVKMAKPERGAGDERRERKRAREKGGTAKGRTFGVLEDFKEGTRRRSAQD